MYVIVLILLATVLALFSWQMVHCQPMVLSRLLPRGLTLFFGGFFMVLGLSCAYIAAHGTRSPEDMLNCFVQGFVGLWFMLAVSAHSRGSYEDERMLRRIYAMIGLIMLVIIGSLYVNEAQVMAILNLMLIAGGFWMTTNYLKYLDSSGRR